MRLLQRGTTRTLGAMKRRLVFAVAGVLLAGCDKELEWSPPLEPVKLQRFDQGRPVASCSLSPDSPQSKSLVAWVSRNKDGWSSSPASYVPRTIVTGGNFSIKFLDALAVVNYPGGQLTKKVAANEAAFLSCPAGT